MTKRIIVLLLVVYVGLAFGQEETKEFKNYQEMRGYIGSLFQQQKYEEAARILENHLARFPDHLEANAYNLALVYGRLKQYQEAINALRYALDRDIWFNKYAFGAEFWEPFKEMKEFKKLLDRNETFRQEAQKSAKPDLLVLMPKGYSKEEGKYPLFIALHGGSSNIDNFRKVWKSKRMEEEFITAYVQSSLVVGMDSYNWREDMDTTKKEIVEAYNEIIKEYPVDEKEVIIGGFSAGGVAALEVTLCDLIPAAGFIVLCPAKPESFSDENIIEAKERGVRGTILATEMDPRLSVQKEMVGVLKTTDFPYQFVVTPNIGHWFPEDLDVKIDEAIHHIRNR